MGKLLAGVWTIQLDEIKREKFITDLNLVVGLQTEIKKMKLVTKIGSNERKELSIRVMRYFAVKYGHVVNSQTGAVISSAHDYIDLISKNYIMTGKP